MLFLARPAVCPGVTVCTHSGGRGGPALTGNTLKVPAPPHLHTLPHLSLSGAEPAPGSSRPGEKSNQSGCLPSLGSLFLF